MSETELVKQIAEIKSIMKNRARFNALSGISGILSGIYALIGAFLAYKIIYASNEILYFKLNEWYKNNDILQLIGICTVVLGLAIITGLYFTNQKAKENGESMWSPVSFKIMSILAVFLGTGGIFLISLFLRGYFSILAPACLIFYGLGLFSIANLTLSEVRHLGLSILIIGIISLFVPGHGLLFWSIGFGVMHIVYGSIMWYKYERKQ